MKKLLFALALLLLLPASALAQCNGVFNANQVCGATASGFAHPVDIASIPPARTAVYLISYGVNVCNGTTDDAPAFNAAIADAAGRPIIIPAGTCIIGSQIVYTTTVFTFGKGIQLQGQNREGTIIDVRVANACAFKFQSNANDQFQSGITIQDIKIISSTSPTAACGFELYRVAYTKFSNVQFTGLTGTGIYMHASAGDADASFQVSMDRVRMDNVGTGGTAWCVQINAPTGGFWGSNLRIENSSFAGCGALSSAVPPTSGGIVYKGLIFQLVNSAFTQNFGPDLYIQGPDSSLFVEISGTDFERNQSTVLPHVYIDGGLRGLDIKNSQCINSDIYVSQGCIWLNTTAGIQSNISVDKMSVAATAGNSTYTAFQLTGGNGIKDSISLNNIYWINFDFSGQVRFSGLQFSPIPGTVQFSISAVNTAKLIPIGYGSCLPIKLAATGEWICYQVPSTGLTVSGLGSATPSTAYNFYATVSSAVNLPITINIERATTATALDPAGYSVKSGDTTRAFIGTATSDGSGNFQVGGTSFYPPH